MRVRRQENGRKALRRPVASEQLSLRPRRHDLARTQAIDPARATLVRFRPCADIDPTNDRQVVSPLLHLKILTILKILVAEPRRAASLYRFHREVERGGFWRAEIKAGDSRISFNYDTVIEPIVSRVSRTGLMHGKDLKPTTIGGPTRRSCVPRVHQRFKPYSAGSVVISVALGDWRKHEHRRPAV